MIKSVGIDFHQGKHVVRCLDERAQLCDSFSFQTTPEGLDTFEEHILRYSIEIPLRSESCCWVRPRRRRKERTRFPKRIFSSLESIVYMLHLA